MRRRKTLFIALALVMIFLYAVPVIRMEGCPYSYFCIVGMNVTYYQSVSMHYMQIGAQWTGGEYYIFPSGVFRYPA
jgi:hypothetical protein